MATKNARFMLTIPEDIAKRAEVLKKDTYYNKPYAEMYRLLIQFGMDSLEYKKREEKIDQEKAYETPLY